MEVSGSLNSYFVPANASEYPVELPENTPLSPLPGRHLTHSDNEEPETAVWGIYTHLLKQISRDPHDVLELHALICRHSTGFNSLTPEEHQLLQRLGLNINTMGQLQTVNGHPLNTHNLAILKQWLSFVIRHISLLQPLLNESHLFLDTIHQLEALVDSSWQIYQDIQQLDTLQSPITASIAIHNNDIHALNRLQSDLKMVSPSTEHPFNIKNVSFTVSSLAAEFMIRRIDEELESRESVGLQLESKRIQLNTEKETHLNELKENQRRIVQLSVQLSQSEERLLQLGRALESRLSAQDRPYLYHIQQNLLTQKNTFNQQLQDLFKALQKINTNKSEFSQKIAKSQPFLNRTTKTETIHSAKTNTIEIEALVTKPDIRDTETTQIEAKQQKQRQQSEDFARILEEQTTNHAYEIRKKQEEDNYQLHHSLEYNESQSIHKENGSDRRIA